MLFVSRFANYRHGVSPGSMRWVRDPSGSERQIDGGDFFWAEFKLGGLELHQQELAVQEFTRINPEHPWGAQPLTGDGTINMQDAASEGEISNSFEGYLPYQRLSRFDTEDGRMCTERWRAATEEALLGSTDLGRDFILLDLLDLTQPWPTYDAVDDPNQAAKYALFGGLRLEPIIRYEKATLNRPAWIAALNVALKQQELQRAEAEALTVTA